MGLQGGVHKAAQARDCRLTCNCSCGCFWTSAAAFFFLRAFFLRAFFLRALSPAASAETRQAIPAAADSAASF